MHIQAEHPDPDRKLSTYDLCVLANKIVDSIHALDEDEDIDGELGDLIFGFFQGLEDKLEALYHVRRRLRADVALLREEERRLAKRRKQLEMNEYRVAGLAKDLLVENERLTGERKVKTPRITASLCSNARPTVVLDERYFPNRLDEPELWKLNPTIDREATYQRLVEGRKLPGATLVHDTHVRFR